MLWGLNAEVSEGDVCAIPIVHCVPYCSVTFCLPIMYCDVNAVAFMEGYMATCRHAQSPL